MLRRCILWRCMSVPEACRTMQLTTVPSNRKELKKRFVALTKEMHPDVRPSSGDAEAATANMRRLVEAYKTLSSVLRHGVHGHQCSSAATSAMQNIKKHGLKNRVGMQPEEMAEAERFTAPGVGLSARGVHLPWQRAATTTATTCADEARLHNANTVSEYVEAAQQLQRQQAERAARIHEDDANISGSHGFNASYFDEMHARSERATVRSTPQSHGLRRVMECGKHAATFYAQRARVWCRTAPERWWRSLRYVLSGQ